jgi:hypothetical protein
MKNNKQLLSDDIVLPETLSTAVFMLIPLTLAHVLLDYATLMQNKAMLRSLSGSPWPQDSFTVADNLVDLEWHWDEHQRRIAFTYTILNLDKTECLGCVYIKSFVNLVETQTTNQQIVNNIGDCEAAVRFWVSQSVLKNKLDPYLLQALIHWFKNDWPFTRVLFHTRQTNNWAFAYFPKQFPNSAHIWGYT